MNQVIQATVRELETWYKNLTDSNIIMEIRMEHHAGEALFYLLFGRYAEMLQAIFIQQAKPSMDFDDFMLELDIRLFAKHCTAIKSFDGSRASFKTYLSKIAYHLVYDLRMKETPTVDITLMDFSTTNDNSMQTMMMVDAINSYPNKDSQYVLFKTIEGYKSKEIAAMLSTKRHEDGTLSEDEFLKPSYIDTLRSRALKDIRRNIDKAEVQITQNCYMPISKEGITSDGVYMDDSFAEPQEMEILSNDFANPFINNIKELYLQMMEN